MKAHTGCKADCHSKKDAADFFGTSRCRTESDEREGSGNGDSGSKISIDKHDHHLYDHRHQNKRDSKAFGAFAFVPVNSSDQQSQNQRHCCAGKELTKGEGGGCFCKNGTEYCVKHSKFLPDFFYFLVYSEPHLDSAYATSRCCFSPYEIPEKPLIHASMIRDFSSILHGSE